MKKRKYGPIQEAQVGSVWELRGSGDYIMVGVVLGEKNRACGNYPLLMLVSGPTNTTKPGQRFNAAVTTAKGWKRIA